MEVSRSPRSAQRRNGVLQALGALTLALLIAGCASSSSIEGTDGSSDGSGGSSNGSGGTAGSDGGTFDGSGPGSGGVSSGSGGSTSSGGHSSSGGATGSGGSSASGGSSGSGGITGAGGSAAQPCTVSFEPLSPPTLTGIEAGPNAKVRLHAVVTYSTVQAPTFTWTVTSSSRGSTVPFTAIDGAPMSIIEFKVTDPDTFQISVSVNDPKCQPYSRTATAVVSKPGFLFRTRASNLPVQEQRIDWSPGASIWIDLQAGRQYTIRPLQADQSSNVLSGYLRLTDPGVNLSVEGTTTHGPLMVNLLTGTVYNLLIVPDDAKVAPLLLRKKPEEFQGFTVDQGLQVGTRTVDANGTPIVGARMMLKNGDLTSTVGTSDSMGQMDLWTRSGTMAAIVVPPDGSGLPQARVDIAADGTGLVVPTNTSSFSLTMTWVAATRSTLTINVMDVDGSTAVAGARVRASLRSSSTPVGILSASGGGGPDMNYSAMGSNNAELVSDAQGQARFTALPAGTYDVTITPPARLGSAATTSLSGLKVTSSGLSRTVTLAQKVSLTGKLAPMPASQGTSITAIDTSSDAAGSTATAVADSNGMFTLSIDPNRTYELIMQPRLDQALGRRAMRDVIVGATGTALGSITLPAAVSVTGNVMSGGKPVAGAFVQVFCVSSSASCVDPTISLGEVTTSSDGSFQVVLPDLTAAVVK